MQLIQLLKSRRGWLVAASLVAVVSASNASAAVIAVPSQFPTIQAGINAAQTGDEVVIGDGTYSGAGNVNLNFNGKAITVRSANGAANCIINCQNASRGFTFDHNETPASILQGVTIEFGVGPPGTAGGIQVGHLTHSAHPTITGCVIRNCVRGMAIFNYTNRISDCAFINNTVSALSAFNSFPVIEDCTFQGNAGATLSFSSDLFGMQALLTLTDCSFTDNPSTAVSASNARSQITGCTFSRNARGLNCSQCVSTNLTDCMFANHQGTAVSDFLTGSVEVINVQFVGNLGEGLRFSHTPTARVSNCLFADNHASVSGAGLAAIGNINSLTVRDCQFLRNVSLDTQSFGGGGGAFLLSATNGVPTTFVNCLFSENSSVLRGGAVFNEGAVVGMQNCVFTGNSAPQGGAVAFVGGSTIAANCTFVHNTASDAGGAVHATGNGQISNSILRSNQPDQVAGSSQSNVRQCNIQGGWSGPGGNNTNSDPLFVDADGPDNQPGTQDDNVRLLPGSPSIDAGANALVLSDSTDLDGDGNFGEATPLDLDSNPRFADDPAAPNIGCGPPVIVDQGAYEKPGVSTPITIVFGDANGDAAVDVDDLLLVVTNWGTCATACCPGDTDGSGAIHVTDMLIVINNWTL